MTARPEDTMPAPPTDPRGLRELSDEHLLTKYAYAIWQSETTESEDDASRMTIRAMRCRAELLRRLTTATERPADGGVIDRLVDTFDSMCPFSRNEIRERIVAALSAASGGADR